MTVKVYVDLRSQPCRALLLFLKNSKIPYEVEYLDLFEGEHKKPAYATKFPLTTVPGLSDGDYHLGETMAIFRYLATKYAGKYPENWYPADPKARGRVDEYMAFHHTGMRGSVMPVFVSEVLTPMMSGKPVPKEDLDKQMEKLNKGLDSFEKGFLKDNDFISGKELTFADALAVTELSQFLVNKHDLSVGRPRLNAYYSRVKARLSPSFDEVHERIYAWRDSYNKK